MDGNTNIMNRKAIEDLIASGGISDGEKFKRHGPFHYKAGNAPINPGEFTTDNSTPKLIRQFTFHKKDQSGEEVVWSDLVAGEVITIAQQNADNYLIINYTVTKLENFGTAIIVDVDAHQTVVAYSDGSVVYNPSDAFDFLPDTDTYAIESQPATLNNVVGLSNKASPAPAFNSYVLDTGTAEPLLGIRKATFIAAGTANIQNPTRFIFSSSDKYGNGQKWGSNTFNCPGSILELYRKNGDGSLCLCKVYEFNKVFTIGSEKFEFQGVVEKHSSTNNNGFISSPGLLSPNTEYLVRHQFNFTTTVYTIDAEGDPHYGDHRLEDVGAPVAATDAATKGYTDSQIEALLVRIEELENNNSGSGSTMANNLQLTLKTKYNNPQSNEIQQFNSLHDKLYIAASGLGLHPRGRIQIREVGQGSPMWLFNIHTVEKTSNNNWDTDRWTIGVGLDTTGVIASSNMSDGKDVYVSFLEGAVSEEPGKGSVRFVARKGDREFKNTASQVLDPTKSYALSNSGALTSNTNECYGLFMPYEFLNSDKVSFAEGDFDVVGLLEGSTGWWYSNSYDVEKVEERTYNGIKGIALWHLWYDNSNDVNIGLQRVSLKINT